MNINSVNNINALSFNAKFKIEKTKSYKPINEWFDKWLADEEEKWVRKAWGIGTQKDTITIKIGKNDIGQGFYRKQNMSASSKVNGIRINNNDLKFEYDRPLGEFGSTQYCYHFSDRVNDYLEFIRRIANATIYKK